MLKYFLSILLSIFLANGLTAEDFVVGTTSAYAPFVTLNDKGQYEGFDIDIATELASRLGKNLVIKDLGSMPTLLIALKQNKIDALIWAMSITEERQKKMELVYYQGEKIASLPLLFWKEIPENIKTITDLVNKPNLNISVEAGSFQETFLLSVPGLKLKQVDKVMDAILELKYGKSAATIIDPSLLSSVLAKFPDIKVLDIPLPAAMQVEGNGICINKNRQDLALQIKDLVQKMQQEGVIAKLEEKWGLKGQ